MTVSEKLSVHDFMGVQGRCKACGSDVSGYVCNGPLISVRPEAYDWDWWYACDNVECENHRGEGVFQDPIDWVEKKPRP